MRRSLLWVMPLLTVVTAATAQESVTLRVGGRVGQSAKYLNVTDMFVGGQMAMMMGGDTSQPFMRKTEYVTRSVDAITADTFAIKELTDSSRTETPMNPSMAAMMGAAGSGRGQYKITKMNTRGDIYEVTSYNDMGEVVSGGPVARPGGRGPGRGRGGMGGNMPGGNTNNIFTLPERPVRVGESWTDTTITPGSGGDPASTSIVTYRLTRVDNTGGRRVAVIAIEGSMSSTTPEGPQEFRMTGELQYDVTGSRLASYDMTMTGTARGPQGEMPVRIHSTQTPVN